MKRLDTIARRCDDFLIASMRPSLRLALDAVLARGATPDEVLKRVSLLADPTSTVSLQVQAYLARRAERETGLRPRLFTPEQEEGGAS